MNNVQQTVARPNGYVSDDLEEETNSNPSADTVTKLLWKWTQKFDRGEAKPQDIAALSRVTDSFLRKHANKCKLVQLGNTAPPKSLYRELSLKKD